MCTDCIIVRAKNFLIITGSFAMVLVIIILFMIMQFVWRIRTGVKKVTELSSQMQLWASIPLMFIERWLSEKKKTP